MEEHRDDMRERRDDMTERRDDMTERRESIGEQWKRNKEFDNYELSMNGQVRNVNTGRILKTTINKKGNEQVCLRKDNRQYTKTVHRLMVDTFLEGDHRNIDIYHENRNRSDNRLSNLRLCSKSETCKRGFREGNRKGRGHINVRTRKIVNGVDKVQEFESIRECARALGVSESAVSKCLNGSTLSCKGYRIEKA